MALADRHNPITRVLLGTADWNSHPRRLRVDGPGHSRVVRLGWFDSMPTGLVTALCANGQRTDLLTVPPHTSRSTAHTAMRQAATAGNLTRAPDILSAITTEAISTHSADVEDEPQSRWESEGGQTHRSPRERLNRAAGQLEAMPRG